MPDVNEVRGAREGTRSAPQDAHDWLRVTERVKRDHAMIRALLDDIERACRAVEAKDLGSLERLRRAVRNLDAAFEDHRATEERYFAPILRTSDAWGELRVGRLLLEQDEQQHAIVELAEHVDHERVEPEQGVAVELVAQARALVRSFSRGMDSEEHALDEAALVPTVVPDQEDG